MLTPVEMLRLATRLYFVKILEQSKGREGKGRVGESNYCLLAREAGPLSSLCLTVVQ